jgi:hypothetical protein
MSWADVQGMVPEPMEDEPGERRLRLTAASSIKPRPVRWLWDQRVALGSLVNIHAPG